MAVHVHKGALPHPCNHCRHAGIDQVIYLGRLRTMLQKNKLKYTISQHLRESLLCVDRWHVGSVCEHDGFPFCYGTPAPKPGAICRISTERRTNMELRLQLLISARFDRFLQRRIQKCSEVWTLHAFVLIPTELTNYVNLQATSIKEDFPQAAMELSRVSENCNNNFSVSFLSCWEDLRI